MNYLRFFFVFFRKLYPRSVTVSARLDTIGLKALVKSRINVPSRSVKRDTNVSITETVSLSQMILVKTATIMLNV